MKELRRIAANYEHNSVVDDNERMNILFGLNYFYKILFFFY